MRTKKEKFFLTFSTLSQIPIFFLFSLMKSNREKFSNLMALILIEEINIIFIIIFVLIAVKEGYVNKRIVFPFLLCFFSLLFWIFLIPFLLFSSFSPLKIALCSLFLLLSVFILFGTFTVILNFFFLFYTIFFLYFCIFFFLDVVETCC